MVKLTWHIWSYVLLIIHSSQRYHTHATENKSDLPQFIFKWIFLISVVFFFFFFVIKNVLTNPLCCSCLRFQINFSIFSQTCKITTRVTWTVIQRLCFLHWKVLCGSLFDSFRILVAPWLWFRHISRISTDKTRNVWTWGGAKGYLLPKDWRRCCCIYVSLEMRRMHHFLPDTAVSLTEDDPRPRDFPWTVFVRVKLLHRVQRNIGCYCVSVSCIYLCEPDNKLATYCVFPPATCCIWLHGLWPLKIDNEKQSNKGNNQLQICKMCYTVFFSVLLLCRLGKLQDTQKKLCFRSWRSRSGFAVWPPTTFWR